jgi:hypothetical protein
VTTRRSEFINFEVQGNFFIFEGIKAGRVPINIFYKGAKTQHLYLDILERTDTKEIQELNSVITNTNLGEIEKGGTFQEKILKKVAELNPKFILSDDSISSDFKIFDDDDYRDYKLQLLEEYFPEENQDSNLH